MDQATKEQATEMVGQVRGASGGIETQSLWTSTSRAILGKALPNRFIQARMGKSTFMGMLVRPSKAAVIPVGICG